MVELDRFPSTTAFLAEEPTDVEHRPTLGMVAGRYDLLDLISTGGMGRVYRARHRELGRIFALKLVLEGMTHDVEIRERFFREARLASSLSHLNVISVTDFGLDEKAGYFLVMELLEGETLRERMDRSRIPMRFACDVLDQVAGAVRYMHGRQVFHCDLKPENIFLTRVEGERRQNIVKLLDFGLSASHAGSSETRICGTPPYLAPERLTGTKPTAQCDVYSMGMMLYESIAGALPWEGDEAQVMEAQLRGPAPERPSLRAREPLDERADELVLRALDRDPEKRQPSAEAFHYELRALMSMMGMRARRHSSSVAPTQTLQSELSGPRESFEVMMMRSPVPLAVIDPAGALRFVNAAFLTRSEGSPTQAPPTFDGLKLARRQPDLTAAWKEVLATKRSIMRLVLLAGDRPAMIVLAPSVKGERVDGVHCTLIDTAQ